MSHSWYYEDQESNSYFYLLGVQDAMNRATRTFEEITAAQQDAYQQGYDHGIYNLIQLEKLTT
jgi:hypothetical protein